MPDLARTTKADPAAPAPAPAPAASRAPAPAALRHGGSPAVRLGGGEPMPRAVRAAVEHSLGTDMGGVRIHSGPAAERAARALSARAFAYGPNIVLGRGERASDLAVMAHEAAHVVQQRGAPVVQRLAAGSGDTLEREAHAASEAVVRGESFAVHGRTSGERVQRLGIDDALDYFADKANNIPFFRMFTIVLGVNPINMSKVDRSPANILRALIEVMPGGKLITDALQNHGIFDKVGAWVEEQINTLGLVGSAIKQAITAFIDSLGLSDLADLDGVWERAKRIFTDPIDRIVNFAKGLVTGIITFIKDAILMPLAKLAEGTRGYDLLKAVLGKDPITGEPVPRNAETLVGGLMKLIGEEEVWENIKKANAVARVWSWFQGALAGLMAFVQQIPTLAVNAFKSLQLVDLVLLPKAFAKVAAVFGDFVGKFITWAGNAVWNLLEIVFSVVAPGALAYIKRVGAAIKSILKNPLPFVRNLVRAAKLGFENFAANFGTHLKTGLINWLTGSLPSVYIPKAFSLGEIVKFVFSVLGLSWRNVRQKLVKVVGEPAVKAMETGFDIVLTLVTQGPAAAWDKLKDQLANLQGMVIGGITDFVVDMVVKKAVPKLIAMFVPGAGFISAILSIYDTIMVFVNKIKQIIQVVTAFIDSLVAIAGGNIGAAAKRVESILAGLLGLAINFLAGFAGLGKVADQVLGVINKVRAPVDKALDALINWIVTMAKKLFAKAFGHTKPGEPDSEASKDLKKRVKTELGNKKITDTQQASTLISEVYNKYKAQGLKGIRLIYDPKKPEKAGVKVSASIAEVIADLPVDKQGLRQALSYARQFNYLARSTVLYVYYDTDNKPYGGAIKNASNNEHAEQVFKNKHLPGLKNQIQDDRNTGKLLTPAGQPVKVELNLNRVPCPICSPILAMLSGMNPDLRFVVKASSAPNTANAEITTEYIEKMLAGGVEVSTLKIFEAIQDKIVEILKASGAKEIALTPNNFVEIEVALPLIRENLSKEQGLQSMINEATKKSQKGKGLAEVPAQGSGT